MKILQHTNQTVRKLYFQLTKESPLHCLGDRYYKTEYVSWMEDKLNELLEQNKLNVDGTK